MKSLWSAIIGLAFAGRALAGAADGTLDIYWNDVEGGGATLIVTPTGESVLIDAGNLIKLSVAPSGKTYTVTIPATGHARTYQTRGH